MILLDHIYSNFNISISLKPSITFAGSTGNLGSVRGRSLKAGRVRRLWRQQCLVLLSSYTVAVCDRVFHLYDFFLLLSTLQRLISLTCLDRFWPNLVPSTPAPSQTWPWGQRSRRVTGVKKVIFTKNATSPTDYRVWSCDSCTCISLTPSTKVMGLKIHPGSFGVTGVKRSFSLKMLLLLQFTGYGHVTHVHASAWPPSTKVMGLKIHPGSFGVTGVKRLFSLKTLLLLQITG